MALGVKTFGSISPSLPRLGPGGGGFATNMRGFTHFDRLRLKRGFKRMHKSPLGKAAALVRMRARQSIRKATGKKQATLQRPAKPGKPPKSRAPGHPFRLIFFDIENFHTRAVIGPMGFGGNPPVPAVHEFGLAKKIKTFKRKKQAKGRGGRFKKKQKAETFHTIKKYPPRPFMGPALLHVAPMLPLLWRGSLKAAA